MTRTVDDQIAQIARGAVELITDADLRKKLGEGKPLRVGHTVLMQKLRRFQELGHQVIFLIGDFTARIGDPSGQSKTRPLLSDAAIKANAKTYTDQAFKILDRKKTEVRFNSEWLGKLTPADLIHLSAQYTLARMIEREDFRKRLQEQAPLSIHELMYPLLQGYDSVALKADVELGGHDQKFNLVVAREIQKSYDQPPEVILTMPLLVGTDGVQKMSKSYGNQIGIQEPPGEMFGKLMSVSDELMWQYYELLSDRSTEEIGALKNGHPKAAKVALAKEMVARFHSAKAAEFAAAEFDKVFAKREEPTDVQVHRVKGKPDGHLVVDLLLESGLVKSKTEARRLIEQKAVAIDDRPVSDINTRLIGAGDYFLRVGKRRFGRVAIER
ncbi:MAG: tyrosine--tRNA ligase [Deltaproteobacteria bacterium]|nr:tyrosine--tRNA ligase [Deltaproteobacteria bacterium]